MKIYKLDSCLGFVVQSDLIAQFVDGNFESLTLNVATNCCDTLFTRTIEDTPVTEHTVVIPITSIGDITYTLTTIKFLVGDSYYVFSGEYDLSTDTATLITELEAWILETFGQTVTVTIDTDLDLEKITLVIQDLAYPVEPISTTTSTGDSDQINVFSSEDNFSLVQTSDEITIGEGVYHIEIIAEAASGSQTIQRTCFFYDCTLACEIGEFILDNCDTDVHLDYYVLKNMEYCECNCDNMCLLYKRILDKLGREFCCGETGPVTTKKCTSC